MMYGRSCLMILLFFAQGVFADSALERCHEEVRKQAQYDVQFLDDESLGSDDMIWYEGNIKLQNGFGAWKFYYYTCIGAYNVLLYEGRRSEHKFVASIDSPAPGISRSGNAVYNGSCVACHGTGAAGAPKLGDKAAWATRIDQGLDTLVKHAIVGFQGKTGVMPPRGTCGACSDVELKAAVEYMVSESKR